MHVKRIIWMGVRTPAHDAMRRLLADVMGLRVTRDEPGVTWFEMDEGDVQIYDDNDVDHAFFGSGPTVGFEVADFDEARRELIAAGVEFLSDPQTDGTITWIHFRGPDGNVYEILGPSMEWHLRDTAL